MAKSKEQKRQDKLFKLHEKHGNVMNLLKYHPLTPSEIKLFLEYEHAKTLPLEQLFDLF
jgi:hypothetical protein